MFPSHISHDHINIRSKFNEDLSANPARSAYTFRIGHNGHRLDGLLPGRNRLAKGYPFGA